MASIEERVGELVEEHLGISDRSLLDANVSELGLNSMDANGIYQGRQSENSGAVFLLTMLPASAA